MSLSCGHPKVETAETDTFSMTKYVPYRKDGRKLGSTSCGLCPHARRRVVWAIATGRGPMIFYGDQAPPGWHSSSS